MPFEAVRRSGTLRVVPPLGDHAEFLGSWLRRPRQVAAVAPSGLMLARLITSEIAADAGPVLELGAGTGVFTSELLAKGVPAADIHVVEIDERFASRLAERFPGISVMVGDASGLSSGRTPLPRDCGSAISGLPILSMPPAVQMRIIGGTFRHLRPGGALYQFTYGPRCPVAPTVLERLGLRAQRIGGVLRNLPPASVYRISRHEDPGLDTPAAA